MQAKNMVFWGGSFAWMLLWRIFKIVRLYVHILFSPPATIVLRYRLYLLFWLVLDSLCEHAGCLVFLIEFRQEHSCHVVWKLFWAWVMLMSSPQQLAHCSVNCLYLTPGWTTPVKSFVDLWCIFRVECQLPFSCWVRTSKSAQSRTSRVGKASRRSGCMHIIASGAVQPPL